MHHFNRPKLSKNSLIRDQKSNKHIANGYKKLVRTFKREAVQFFVAENLAVNHLPLEHGLPNVTKTGNGERGAGNGERGTEVWERVVSGNLHKNPIWPMIDDREPSKQT